MAVAVGSTKIDGSTILISASGTDAEVRAELGTGTAANALKTGVTLKWSGDAGRIIASGGDATACFVIYMCSKP